MEKPSAAFKGFKMKLNLHILAHRGYWLNASEKNSFTALERAFKSGFGIETDLRDHDGDIIISHDMPQNNEELITFDTLLELYKPFKNNTNLALNIKADGLQQHVRKALKNHNISLENIFFFDMSVPDALGYIRGSMPCFTRYSEYENTPSFLSKAKGVWVDAFLSEEGQLEAALQFLKNGLDIALVSPELHKREHLSIWESWKKSLQNIATANQTIYLCTDYPEDAKVFFNDE